LDGIKNTSDLNIQNINMRRCTGAASVTHKKLKKNGCVVLFLNCSKSKKFFN